MRFDLDGRLVEANPAAARLFGFGSSGELLEAARRGETSELAAFSWVERFGRSDEPIVSQVRLRRAGEVSRTCRIVATSVREGGGELIGAQAILEDITTGIDPPPADDLLTSLLNGLPTPVFVKDEQHRWVILNDDCCRLMGHPRERLLGKSDYDFFPKSEADVFWAKDAAVFETGVTNENEEYFSDADGRKHVILTRKSLHTDASGRRLLLGVITDITRRKEKEEALIRSHDELDRRVAERTEALAEANRRLNADIAERRLAAQRLRESEERFRQLADSLPQLVWIGRPDGTIEYVNRQWSEFVGCKPGEVSGQGWQTILHPDDLSACMANWQHTLETGEALEAEYRLLRHDGVQRWHLARALRVCSADGETLRWFGSLTDIEDQKRQQEALVAGDARKNEFLALLGHELRNPLTPIRNAVFLLRRIGRAEPSLWRAVEIIDRQVTQMARLIDDLLDISRIRCGKILLREELVDLGALVRSAVDDRRENLQGDGLSIEASFPPSPLFVRADPARILQAVGNLLDNAEKFTNAGGRIAVSVQPSEDGRTASVTVRDTGIGMSRQTMERLFEPFAQAERSLERSRGGLGLGLSLVRGLIELHHGTVTAESPGEGCGSSFTIRLPLEARPAEAPSAAAPEDVPSARRILVIEDNLDTAETLALALSLEGHDVRVAHTAEEGIEEAHAFHPGVVLSDIGLPGPMDGYDLARAMRGDHELASVHLIAISGYGQTEDRGRAMEAGFDRHLTKPFDIELLARVIANLPLEHGGSRAGLGA